VELDWAFPVDLGDIPLTAVEAERLGYAGLWTTETPHDPFLPTLAAGLATKRLRVGTGVATAFTRSPMVTALTAWDIQAATGGRFTLGLGSQVKAHNARRYGTPADAPGPRMRELVDCLRHIWGAFQGNHPLRFEGRFFQLDLFTPMHSPGPIADPTIPIFLAAVQPYGYRLAGQVAEGVHVHTFSTPAYLTKVGLPALDEGLTLSGRTRADLTLAASLLTCVGDDRAVERAVRQQIAFYGSTSAYRGVLDAEGLGYLAEPFKAAVIAGDPDALAAAVTDEALRTFAVVAPDWDAAAREIDRRWGGILDRVSIYALGGSARHDHAAAIAAALTRP
jgi:probable F420-dependent oxidoreductase